MILKSNKEQTTDIYKNMEKSQKMKNGTLQCNSQKCYR